MSMVPNACRAVFFNKLDIFDHVDINCHKYLTENYKT